MARQPAATNGVNNLRGMHINRELTAAWREAYSTGTRKLKAASGGGLVQSRATASSSYKLLSVISRSEATVDLQHMYLGATKGISRVCGKMAPHDNTHHTDSLHIAVREGEQPLSRDSHLGLSVSKLGFLVALALELAPERLGGQAATCGSNGHIDRSLCGYTGYLGWEKGRETRAYAGERSMAYKI